MNRTELVDKVASTTGLERRQAEAAVMAFIDSVVSETRSGSKVSIFGFGTFTPKHQPGRPGRNPRTGAAVKIAPRNVVRFSPATAFKEALNTRGTKKAAAKKAAPAAKATKAPAKATSKAAPAKATKAPAKAASKTAKAPSKATKAPAKTVKATKATKAPATKATKATRATKK